MPLTLKCPKCSWTGSLSETMPHDNGYQCPSCKASNVETIRDAAETIHDIEGAEHMVHKHGERFQGYYLFKAFKEVQTLPLGIDELTYRFNISKFEIRFVMPSKVEFIGGIISYNDGERDLGVFRFPRGLDGKFMTPVAIPKDPQSVSTFTQEDVEKLLQAPRPLVFDAFKVPRFSFEYLDISSFNVQEIEQITGAEHAQLLKNEYDKNLDKILEGVKAKITSAPNFLLILENTLNQFWKNLDEVALATSGIIHI